MNGHMKLFSWEECKEFDIKRVQKLYKSYVNKGQVNLIGSFGFGRTISKKSLGMYIYTSDNKKILDFTGGIGVLNHGHNHPRILDVRRRYQDECNPEVHKNYLSQYIAGLSHNIAMLLPDDLNISYFCNSGSEAVEGAVKLAYKYQDGSRKFIANADIAFHGKLLGSAGLTGSPELRYKFPTIPNTKNFEYNNFESIHSLVSQYRNKEGESDFYAIILEPFNASSLRQCDSEYLHKLRKLCNEEGIILIFDEVYTGWAKCGALFYFMNHNIIPDIVTYAKSFGGGKASISGYTTKTTIFDKAYGNLADSILHSTTYNGFGEETITAIEAINIIIEDNYIERSKHIYKTLNRSLLDLKVKYPDFIDEVRGCGALNGIILNKEISKAMKNALAVIPIELFKDKRFIAKLITSSVISELYNTHDILTFYGDNRDIPLIISPSLIVTDNEIEKFIDSLDKTLALGKFKLLLRFAMQKWG